MDYRTTDHTRASYNCRQDSRYSQEQLPRESSQQRGRGNNTAQRTANVGNHAMNQAGEPCAPKPVDSRPSAQSAAMCAQAFTPKPPASAVAKVAERSLPRPLAITTPSLTAVSKPFAPKPAASPVTKVVQSPIPSVTVSPPALLETPTSAPAQKQTASARPETSKQATKRDYYWTSEQLEDIFKQFEEVAERWKFAGPEKEAMKENFILIIQKNAGPDFKKRSEIAFGICDVMMMTKCPLEEAYELSTVANVKRSEYSTRDLEWYNSRAVLNSYIIGGMERAKRCNNFLKLTKCWPGDAEECLRIIDEIESATPKGPEYQKIVDFYVNSIIRYVSERSDPVEKIKMARMLLSNYRFNHNKVEDYFDLIQQILKIQQKGEVSDRQIFLSYINRYGLHDLNIRIRVAENLVNAIDIGKCSLREAIDRHEKALAAFDSTAGDTKTKFEAFHKVLLARKA